MTAEMLYPVIVKTSALGLLAYIFGLRLDSGYPKYELNQIHNGLIETDMGLLGRVSDSVDVDILMIKIEDAFK